MAIFTYIDLSSHQITQDNIEGIAELLIGEFNAAIFSKPRTIYVIATGIGNAVGELMKEAGLPAEIMPLSEWNSSRFTLDCSGTYPGETGV
jgi:hypothetical protein